MNSFAPQHLHANDKDGHKEECKGSDDAHQNDTSGRSCDRDGMG